MKDFMEDLGKKLGETAEKVTTKTGEYIEVQKIKNQIRALERSNDRDFADMGKMAYDRFCAGEKVGDEAQGLCSAIKQREEKIAELEADAANARGAVACPTCKRNVEKGMLYCPYCGVKVPVDAWKSEMKDKAREAADKAADKAKEAADKAMSKAEDIAEEIRNKAGNIFEDEDIVDGEATETTAAETPGQSTAEPGTTTEAGTQTGADEKE